MAKKLKAITWKNKSCSRNISLNGICYEILSYKFGLIQLQYNDYMPMFYKIGNIKNAIEIFEEQNR